MTQSITSTEISYTSSKAPIFDFLTAEFIPSEGVYHSLKFTKLYPCPRTWPRLEITELRVATRMRIYNEVAPRVKSHPTSTKRQGCCDDTFGI